MTERRCTLDEAQSLASFDIVLPTYIPARASLDPQLFYRPEGAPTEGLRVVYPEEYAAPGSEAGLRITIIEAPGDLSLPREYDVEVIDVKGVEIELVADPSDLHEARIMTAWKYSGTAFGTEFLWLSGGSAQGAITSAMRAEAVRVIASMMK